MKINSLSIENIKGIGKNLFDLDLYPNKPVIFVAPNGFGKSSIACAFKSLNKNRINLDEDNCYEKNKSNQPKIELIYECNKYVADNNKNAISVDFDIQVINCQLEPEAKRNNHGKYITISKSLMINPIVLIDTIPEKKSFIYKISDLKRTFGKNGKILPSADGILNNFNFWGNLESCSIDWSVFNKKKYQNVINSVLLEINKIEGTADDIKSEITGVINLDSLSEIKKNVQAFYEQCSDVDAYLIAWQIAELSKESIFKEAKNYQIYLSDKKFYEKLLADMNSSWCTIIPKEEKRGSKKSLVVKFPKATDISNGQRDILTFVSQLHKAEKKLKKKKCILIIDEIFDYLDDSNLIAFQYYITKFIEKFKNSEKELFPIMLTHLDPLCFNHFCFSRHKMQIKYLNKSDKNKSKKFKELVKNRDNELLKNDLDTFFFHFHIENKDLSDSFKKVKIDFSSSEKFRLNAYNEVEKYLGDKEYDSIGVLFGLRIKIEENCFHLLASESQKEDFLKTHKTKCKLEYTSKQGVDVPEIYFLLGIIYNDNLHWNDKRDYDTPLITKLENIVIKKMIKSVFE